MGRNEKRWEVSPKIPDSVYYNLDGFQPIFRQILYNRGIENQADAERFIHGVPDHDGDPFRLLGMETAIDRIERAIQRKELISIYGDYDVDGVTATALLTEVIGSAGGKVEGYIPNRFDEGYGLNVKALSDLKARGTQLVITVDCGIRSLDEVAHANEIGLDIIISDHHHPGDTLPNAVAVINPKQAGDHYPFKELAGVGLAYKIASALYDPNDPVVNQTLDLVALGTVADLALLVDENRALVRAGLEQIRYPHRQGLQSLLGVAMIDPPTVTARDIGYKLGPRLNAAGRLNTAQSAFELLLTNDLKLAAIHAQDLNNDNRERQRETVFVQQDAEAQALAGDEIPPLLFAVSSEYNVGVVGLAASRLTDRYYRPAIVAYQDEEYTRGSCRSIPEFHITEALDEFEDMFEHHGGHAAAAGFTIRNERLDEFRTRITELAEETLAGMDLLPVLQADAEVHLSELRPEILTNLEWLEPTGIGNPSAKFISRDLSVLYPKKVGKDGSHLKMSLTDRKITYDAIAFGQGEWVDRMPQRVDIFFTFEKNEYQGRVSFQLNVRDLKPSAKYS